MRESGARCVTKGPGVDEQALLDWLLSHARTFCEGTLCIVVAVMGANSLLRIWLALPSLITELKIHPSNKLFLSNCWGTL